MILSHKPRQWDPCQLALLGAPCMCFCPVTPFMLSCASNCKHRLGWVTCGEKIGFGPLWSIDGKKIMSISADNNLSSPSRDIFHKELKKKNKHPVAVYVHDLITRKNI